MKKTIWCAFFSIFFNFHFRALLTEVMEKEHAHINGGGCNTLATCLLSSYFCLEIVHSSYFLFFQIASARAHYTCAFISTCARPGPLLAVHTHPKPCSPRRHPSGSLFCLSLTPSSILFPLMYRVAKRLSFAAHSLHPPSSFLSCVSISARLSLRPRKTVTPPPWSFSWRQARTRRQRTR